MATWQQFAAAAPDLAAAIRRLMYQFGPGLGYLATVRGDGGPRVHPVSPVITTEGLYCFVVDSPKRRDLDRDARYALHSFPPDNSDDEAYLTGRVVPVEDTLERDQVASSHHAAPQMDWRLYEFTVEVAMLAMYPHQGSWPPTYMVWRDQSGAPDAPDDPDGEPQPSPTGSPRRRRSPDRQPGSKLPKREPQATRRSDDGTHDRHRHRGH